MGVIFWDGTMQSSFFLDVYFAASVTSLGTRDARSDAARTVVVEGPGFFCRFDGQQRGDGLTARWSRQRA